MTDLYTALNANGGELLSAVLADAEIPDEDATAEIKSVCEDIDTLTYNRITDFFALTPFQREKLLRVCVRFLRFKRDNAELLGSMLKSYAIGGVSMSFDDASVRRIGGVTVPGDVYALLRQTGLTCRVV